MFVARLRLAITLAAAALPLAAGPALAHAKLLKAVPAVNGTAMPLPDTLQLSFSEAPELAFTRVKVTGPDAKLVPTGPLTAAAADPDAIVVPLPKGLADGKYTVDWTAVTDDGHKTTGSYSFVAMQ